jgi:hypothetical protein
MSPSAADLLSTIWLSRVHYYADHAQTPDELRALSVAQNAACAVHLASTFDRLIVRLTAFVYAEMPQAEDVTVVFHAPTDWWQHLRAQVRVWANGRAAPWWLPERLRTRLRALRIRTKQYKEVIRFEHFVKYPDCIPMRGLKARTGLGFGVGLPEIRVNGSTDEDRQVRRVEATPWWESKS